jgi:hypothetical protein
MTAMRHTSAVRVTGDGNQDLKDVWVYLTPDEAREILQAFQAWSEEREGYDGRGWHMHLTDADLELTLAIDPADDGTSYAKRS